MATVYVSYDGALDPLGASQVVPYLVGLSTRGVSITLISFEKPERWRDVTARETLRRQLQDAGIHWRPLRYHRWPRVPATLWDMARGALAIRAAVRQTRAVLVHCRGDVTMAMARWSRLRTPLLYDIRGFFADERVRSGSWKKGGWLDRVVRRHEAKSLARADGIVVLTESAVRVLAKRHSPLALPPHRVIPTCVDMSRFQVESAHTPEFAVIY